MVATPSPALPPESTPAVYTLPGTDAAGSSALATSSPAVAATPVSTGKSVSKAVHKAIKGIFVDVGGYATPAQAQQISEALAQATDISIQSIEKGGQNPYVIRVGPFPSMSEANYILDQVGATGHTSRLVILHP